MVDHSKTTSQQPIETSQRLSWSCRWRACTSIPTTLGQNHRQKSVQPVRDWFTTDGGSATGCTPKPDARVNGCNYNRRGHFGGGSKACRIARTLRKIEFSRDTERPWFDWETVALSPELQALEVFSPRFYMILALLVINRALNPSGAILRWRRNRGEARVSQRCSRARLLLPPGLALVRDRQAALVDERGQSIKDHAADKSMLAAADARYRLGLGGPVTANDITVK